MSERLYKGEVYYIESTGHPSGKPVVVVAHEPGGTVATVLYLTLTKKRDINGEYQVSMEGAANISGYALCNTITSVNISRIKTDGDGFVCMLPEDLIEEIDLGIACYLGLNSYQQELEEARAEIRQVREELRNLPQKETCVSAASAWETLPPAPAPEEGQEQELPEPSSAEEEISPAAEEGPAPVTEDFVPAATTPQQPSPSDPVVALLKDQLADFRAIIFTLISKG